MPRSATLGEIIFPVSGKDYGGRYQELGPSAPYYPHKQKARTEGGYSLAPRCMVRKASQQILGGIHITDFPIDKNGSAAPPEFLGGGIV